MIKISGSPVSIVEVDKIRNYMSSNISSSSDTQLSSMHEKEDIIVQPQYVQLIENTNRQKKIDPQWTRR